MKVCLKCGFDVRKTDFGWHCPWCGFEWEPILGKDGDLLKDGGLSYLYSRTDHEREVPWGCLLVMASEAEA